MVDFKEYLDKINEKNNDKVIFVVDTLWVTYGQSSGTTSYMPNIKAYLTDNKDDEHYDSIVPKLLKFSHSNKPLKSNSSTKLFEIPFYELNQNGRSYDIWGGDIKPIKKYYITITEEKNTIVNIFTNKNEAINWIKYSK
jgi:hypothetical protein